MGNIKDIECGIKCNMIKEEFIQKQNVTTKRKWLEVINARTGREGKGNKLRTYCKGPEAKMAIYAPLLHP